MDVTLTKGLRNRPKLCVLYRTKGNQNNKESVRKACASRLQNTTSPKINLMNDKYESEKRNLENGGVT
jgi:hypothetical protein